MRLFWSQVVIALSVIIHDCRADTTKDKNNIDSNDSSEVVYLIDTLDGSKSVTDKSGTPHGPSYTLVDPIWEELAGDGVYFRPADGKPLAKPEVKILVTIFIYFKKQNNKIFSILNDFRRS